MEATTTYGTDMKKDWFTLNGDVTFINHGSYGSVPRPVQEAQQRILSEIDRNPDLWFRVTREKKLLQARKSIAEFVNADPDDVVFVQNATTGINTVLKSIKFHQDDTILYTDNTYNAVKNTCKRTTEISTAEGVCADFITVEFPIKSEDDVIRLYEDYFRKNKNVKIAVIDHISSQSSIKWPIEKLISLCKIYGVMSLIDGAHAPGQIPLDITHLNPDFYTGNLHKWLFCPRGCAILYVNKKHQEWVKPLVTGHGHKTTFQNDFLNQGTRDDSSYCVVPDAVKFYNDIGGYERITSYVDTMLSKASQMMMTEWNTEMLPIPKSMEAPFMRMILLPHEIGKDVHSQGDGDNLSTDIIVHHNIVAVVTFINGKAYNRISGNVYNTDGDYVKMARYVLSKINTHSKHE